MVNLKDIENNPNYTFIKADICGHEKMEQLFVEHKMDGMIHLAAELHVDRSVKDPFSFAKMNVLEALSLLQAAKKTWKDNFEGKLFYHVSTDEMYGLPGNEGFFFRNNTPYICTYHIRLQKHHQIIL